MIPLDPAAIEAELRETEELLLSLSASNGLYGKLIATCRTLLAELARSGAAVEVVKAAVQKRDAQHELSLGAIDAVPLAAIADEKYDAALVRWREMGAARGMGEQEKERR